MFNLIFVVCSLVRVFFELLVFRLILWYLFVIRMVWKFLEVVFSVVYFM